MFRVAVLAWPKLRGKKRVEAAKIARRIIISIKHLNARFIADSSG
jgi:hypothetical protein